MSTSNARFMRAFPGGTKNTTPVPGLENDLPISAPPASSASAGRFVFPTSERRKYVLRVAASAAGTVTGRVKVWKRVAVAGDGKGEGWTHIHLFDFSFTISASSSATTGGNYYGSAPTVSNKSIPDSLITILGANSIANNAGEIVFDSLDGEFVSVDVVSPANNITSEALLSLINLAS
jgi:hypothetical protein